MENFFLNLTETRFSSTNGVSMWCLMVAMMSLKSKAVIVPLLFLSFCANAWRACSDCSSCSNTQRGGQAVSWQKEQRMCSCDEAHRITRQQRNKTLEDKSIIISVLDTCESHRMWQCQTLALVITTVSLETNGNHVPRSLIPEPSRAVAETAGRCVCRKMIQYDNPAIRWGCRGGWPRVNVCRQRSSHMTRET